MSWVDPLVLLWVALIGLVGYQRGLAAQAFSVAGVVLGAFAGARLTPLFLDGSTSPWVPFASLVGAVVGALVFQVFASMLGTRVRKVIPPGPARAADSVGGVLLGAAVGLAVTWLVAVAALQVDRSGLRQTVQHSAILSGLVDAVPPRAVLRTLARLDPLPLLTAPPDLRLPPPGGSVLASAVPHEVAASIVKVESVACGVAIQGSGWVVGRNLVVTNAHVIAGEEETFVGAPNGQVLAATVVYVDAGDDIAILRVPGLRAPPLRIDQRAPVDEEVILIGYPNDGPLVATAATAGSPMKLLAPDAYGNRVRLRTVVPLRGTVQRGDSGGPVVRANGEVVGVVFAASRNGEGGFGVPVEEVLTGLSTALEPVPAGPCVS